MICISPFSSHKNVKPLLTFNPLQSQQHSQPPGSWFCSLVTPQCFSFIASSVTGGPAGTGPHQISAIQSKSQPYFLVILLLNPSHSPVSPLTDPSKTVAVVFQPHRHNLGLCLVPHSHPCVNSFHESHIISCLLYCPVARTRGNWGGKQRIYRGRARSLARRSLVGANMCFSSGGRLRD